jgi:hypothetical protein
MLTIVYTLGAAMARRPSRFLIAVLGVVALIATNLSTAAAAEAAPPNHCGSSYALIDSYPIKSGTTTAGHVYLYWSSSAKRNCSTAIAQGNSYGFKGFKTTWVCPSGNTDASLCGEDPGQYLYYAGPAYTKAGYNMSGKCVEVGGMIEMPNGDIADGGALRVHCG